MVKESDYMAKQIYYLHSCNEWKEYSSMRLLFIGTSQQKLKMKISKEIEEGNMEYKPVTTRYDYVDGEFKLVDKENTPKELFENPQTPRLQDFLSKVL